MDLLGIGPAELLLILLVIILVVGPKDIGKTARSIGRFLNRLYKSEEWRTIIQASKTIRTLPNRLAREAELEDLKEVRSALEETKKGLDEAKKELDQDVKMIGQVQKELDQETRAIDSDMKAWIEPAGKETSPSKVVTSEVEVPQETEEGIAQENPTEGELQNE
jgi:Sec-independent protein translocase protein TatA